MIVVNLKFNLSVKNRWIILMSFRKYEPAYDMHMAYNLYQIFFLSALVLFSCYANIYLLFYFIWEILNFTLWKFNAHTY